jgi:hypothetical protein
VSGSAGAEASALSTDNLSTAGRILGVVRRPRSIFAAIAVSPRWAAPLVLLFAVYFVVSAGLFATDVGRQALVDQWESTAIAFGQPVDDARYAELVRWSERGTAYAAMMAFVTGPAAAVLLATVLFGWFTGVHGGIASYGQVLGVVAHAAVILMLRHVVTAPINYARETMASPTTLATFFRLVDQGSLATRFFALIDFFVVWWLVVLATGIAVLYRERTRPVLALFVGVYAGIALVLAAVMAALGGV